MCASRSGVLCICGLPGVGKSYVAATVAVDTGLTVLSTDALRRRDADEGRELRSVQDYYDLLFDELDRALASGHGCILDATFFRRIWRDGVARLVSTHHSSGFLLELRSPESLAKRRISERISSRTGVVDFGVYESIQRDFEPISSDEASAWTWYGVDSSTHWNRVVFYEGPGRGVFCVQ